MAKTKTTDGKVTLYCYVSPDNADFAKWYGRKKYGSFSLYVDKLITRDRSKNKREEAPKVE